METEKLLEYVKAIKVDVSNMYDLLKAIEENTSHLKKMEELLEEIKKNQR